MEGTTLEVRCENWKKLAVYFTSYSKSNPRFNLLFLIVQVSLYVFRLGKARNHWFEISFTLPLLQ